MLIKLNKKNTLKDKYHQWNQRKWNYSKNYNNLNYYKKMQKENSIKLSFHLKRDFFKN